MGVRDTRNTLLKKDNEILERFTNLYSSLYTSQSQRDISLFEGFLASIPYPSLTEEQRAPLELPISKLEVLRAVKDLNPGKASGPDGFTADFL